jgi:hypothetical protein
MLLKVLSGAFADGNTRPECDHGHKRAHHLGCEAERSDAER